MQRLILACSLAVLAGSATTGALSAQDSTAKPVDTTAAKHADTTAAKPADSTAAKPAAAAAAAPMAMGPTGTISLKDVAGKWAVRATNDVGDLTLMTFNLLATADTTGWAISVGKRRPVPVRVTAVAGDSIVFEAGPYESLTRKGIKVTLFNVTRLQDGKLVGATVAKYATSAPDSVLEMQFEGTRLP
jgi:hypothetical protein